MIYPDKVRLNCHYYRHYSFWKDIEMIFATVLGFKVKFAEEEVYGIRNYELGIRNWSAEPIRKFELGNRLCRLPEQEC